jgi:UDP-N-acetylenolpyruvoylglucosamine reductase
MTARAYHVTRLDDDQVESLHERENGIGYPVTPFMIKQSFSLSEIGQVPDEMSEKQESQIVAIYERTRNEYKKNHAGCCFKNADGFFDRSDTACKQNADLVVVHQSDWLIRTDRHLSMKTPTAGGKARETIRSRLDRAA